jgi:hypothetical protein
MKLIKMDGVKVVKRIRGKNGQKRGDRISRKRGAE